MEDRWQRKAQPVRASSFDALDQKPDLKDVGTTLDVRETLICEWDFSESISREQTGGIGLLLLKAKSHTYTAWADPEEGAVLHYPLMWVSGKLHSKCHLRNRKQNSKGRTRGSLESNQDSCVHGNLRRPAFHRVRSAEQLG